MIDNKFEIQAKVGEDDIADYLHVQDYLFSDYILKVVRPDSFSNDREAAKAFDKEQRLLSKFKGHPNLLQTFGSSLEGLYQWRGEEGYILYSIYEPWRMNTLKNYISQNGPLSLDMVKNVFGQLLQGLNYIHEREYVHLNLSLDNIWLDQNMEVKITGLDQVQKCDPWNPWVRNKTGIYPYKAPEMEKSYKDLYDSYAADIYSLAIWIFEIVTGISPPESTLLDTFFSYEYYEDIDTDTIADEDLTEKSGFSHIPSELKSLLCRMTSLEALNRPTIEEIQRMDFLKPNTF